MRVSAQEFESIYNSDTAVSKAPRILQDRSLLLVGGIQVDMVVTVYADMVWRTENPGWKSILKKLGRTCSEAGKGDEQSARSKDFNTIHFRNLIRTTLTASTEQELADADERSSFQESYTKTFSQTWKS